MRAVRASRRQSVPAVARSEINLSPAAFADAFMATEDTPLTVTAANRRFLKNDTDADSDTLTASVTQAPMHGTLTLNANGSFTYTPAANYSGADTFKYRVYDGQFYSQPVTVNMGHRRQRRPRRHRRLQRDRRHDVEHPLLPLAFSRTTPTSTATPSRPLSSRSPRRAR